MFGLRKTLHSDELLTSRLLNQDNFYQAFVSDLTKARREVIVESPFMSLKRLNHLLPTFSKLVKRGVRVIINTKPLAEQDAGYQQQADQCIAILQEAGVDVLLTGGHHRKIVIIDRQILYEGSLNILSQYDSCESVLTKCRYCIVTLYVE